MLAKETRATIRYVRIDSDTGMLDQEQFASLLNEKTKMVAFQHASNVMACVNPVQDMVDYASRRPLMQTSYSTHVSLSEKWQWMFRRLESTFWRLRDTKCVVRRGLDFCGPTKHSSTTCLPLWAAAK